MENTASNSSPSGAKNKFVLGYERIQNLTNYFSQKQKYELYAKNCRPNKANCIELCLGNSTTDIIQRNMEEMKAYGCEMANQKCT